MSTLSTVVIAIFITLGLGLFLNAYFKGKKVLQKIRDQSRTRNFPVE
jgi:hypothetical protein